jgi:hypothetical protein
MSQSEGGISVLANSLKVLAGQVSSSTFFGDGYVNESSEVSRQWSDDKSHGYESVRGWMHRIAGAGLGLLVQQMPGEKELTFSRS